ncbi:hypothetical protein M9978_12380 [Sphingomonas sp. MG17]|uniref:Fumarylacetoacetase-like C-terminal domain-containing protein n=1 Tax=Sphingomonas tagetis TaxID=2949092 RepID=A0A9X2HP59_9SPHN|nr:hypothetical protein [Sphingomonas tagetis]
MVGTLTASLIRQSGDSVEIGSDPTVMECELGAVLRRDLEGPGLTDLDILAAIEGFLPAIKVAPVRPGVRERAYSWQHMIAVQKAAGGYVVTGGRLTRPAGFDARLEGCLVSVDGSARAGAIGYEAMGNPLRVIAAMADRLSTIGERLRAGQLVITGSLPPPQPVSVGHRTVRAEFTTLGSVEVGLCW